MVLFVSINVSWIMFSPAICNFLFGRIYSIQCLFLARLSKTEKTRVFSVTTLLFQQEIDHF